MGKLFRILITKTGFSPVWFLYAPSKDQLEKKLGTLITRKSFFPNLKNVIMFFYEKLKSVSIILSKIG